MASRCSAKDCANSCDYCRSAPLHCDRATRHTSTPEDTNVIASHQCRVCQAELQITRRLQACPSSLSAGSTAPSPSRYPTSCTRPTGCAPSTWQREQRSRSVASCACVSVSLIMLPRAVRCVRGTAGCGSHARPHQGGVCFRVAGIAPVCPSVDPSVCGAEGCRGLAIKEISSPYDWTLSTRYCGTASGFVVCADDVHCDM